MRRAHSSAKGFGEGSHDALRLASMEYKGERRRWMMDHKQADDNDDGDDDELQPGCAVEEEEGDGKEDARSPGGLQFRNISISIRTRRKRRWCCKNGYQRPSEGELRPLLTSVTGQFAPGDLVAILGTSGMRI